MTTIQLSPTVRIVCDHPEYRIDVAKVLGEKSARAGEIVWKDVGWYYDLTLALRACLHRGLVLDGDVTLTEAIERIEAAANLAAEAVRGTR